MPGAYAEAGVDYTKLQKFKDIMVAMGKRTLGFPLKRDVEILPVRHAHSAPFRYTGPHSHIPCSTTEGLGNKNWIAEWMYMHAGTGRTYYDNIGVDAMLMAINDVIAQGAMPVMYTDEVPVGDGDWFTDEQRNHDLAESYFRGCELTGVALPAGETPALKYLLKPEPPVKACPSLSGNAVGIVAPAERLITGENMQAGDLIIGVPSWGIHCNGISLVIDKAMALPEQFLTPMPDEFETGRTLGEEALLPTRSYVEFVEALLNAGVDVHALVPGTGDGVGKLAFDKRPFTYRVTNWLEEIQIPPLFLYMLQLGVSLEDCLKTFNWGMGYYAFVPEADVDKALFAVQLRGYGDAMVVGQIEEGKRQTIFEPAGITLPPPGE